jgi:hypothetical protein
VDGSTLQIKKTIQCEIDTFGKLSDDCDIISKTFNLEQPIVYIYTLIGVFIPLILIIILIFFINYKQMTKLRKEVVNF